MTDKNTALIRKDIEYIKDLLEDFKCEISAHKKETITRLEFDLTCMEYKKRITMVERLVFGAVGLGLVSIGNALIGLVVQAKAGL